MNFNQFLHKAFPELSVLNRKHLGKFHNFIKYLAIRFAYLLYKLRMTANLLDVISLIMSVFGFYFIFLSIHGYKFLPLVGVCIIFFHIWVDFIDGVLAKARDQSSMIGHQFDNLGCDVDRFMLIVLFGIFTQNDLLLISNVFTGYILIVFHPQTNEEIKRFNIFYRVQCLFSHKLSILGVRFMLGIIPLVILSAIFFKIPLSIIGYIFTSIYSILALIWLIICIPSYMNKPIQYN